MSINSSRQVFTMNVTPYKNFGEPDDKVFHSLIDPDDEGPWAIRYLWIQHRLDNDAFYENYFNGGNNTGYNVRKQTTDLKQHWNYHNQIFDKSAQNGDLVYRIKVGNSIDKSIDYVEIWRSVDILEKYFGAHDTQINNDLWQRDERKQFAKELFDRGFDIRALWPYRKISKIAALEGYRYFIDRFRNKENCIINTRWNRELNPF